MLANFDRMTTTPGRGRGPGGVGNQPSKANYPDALFMNAILSRRSDLLNTYLPPNAMGGAHPSDNVALALTLADWQKL